MDFRKEQIVKVNKEIATEDFLNDCYFCASIKRAEILKDKRYIITDLVTKRLRSGKAVKAAYLKERLTGATFGWIPLEALIPVGNVLPKLKVGTILKTREAGYFTVANEKNAFAIHLLGGKESLCNWNKDTGKHCLEKDFDIVAVYDTNDMCGFKGLATATPIWTEPTPAREMTVAEIEKELGHGVKVVGEDGEWEF